ncbi:MAG: phage GP46 family protein [Methylophilus sp.]
MIKLIQTKYGQFDLAMQDEATPVALQVAKTIVYATLFTDQRAANGRVADPLDQRGWWYDPAMGVGIWYVRRQALSAAARRETIVMIDTALRDYEGMFDVVVTDLSSAGNVSSVEIDITGSYYGTQFHVVISDDLIP